MYLKDGESRCGKLVTRFLRESQGLERAARKRLRQNDLHGQHPKWGCSEHNG